LTTYNFHPPFRIILQAIIFSLLILSLCAWATRTLTLPYSRITTTSTQTLLLVIPRSGTVTS
jgi:hypothetical protein